MKKIIYATTVACMVFTAVFPQEKSRVSYSKSDDSRSGKSTSTIEITNKDLHLKLECTGNITLNDSETAIANISAGGMLTYSKNGSRLEAESNNDGSISYRLHDKGKELSPQSEEGAKFIAAVIKELISFGVDAEHHVDRIYRRGGTDAVLAEIGKLSSDYVKQLYFQELFTIGSLTTAEMNEAAKGMAAMHGNYEKGQLLQKFAKAYLVNIQTVQAYFDAARTIGGDYEKSQVLQAALSEHPGNSAMEQLLKVAATVGGDFEKGQVLQAALTGPVTDTTVGQLLAVAATISGDFEKAQVLKKVTRVDRLTEENCNRLLSDADAIQGAFEKAGVLREVITSDSLSNNSFNRLLEVAGHINSVYEKSGVLKALAALPGRSTEEWINLIKATAGVDAGYEKSTVLVTIASKMPADTYVREAYMTTAKTIGSNYDYEQAVKAVK